MKNKKVIKIIFQEFLKTTWKTKFSFVVFFGVIVAILLYLEPIFFTQIIKIIEWFIKSWDFDLQHFIKLMVFWWIFIVVSTGSLLVYRYNFVTRLVLKNYTNLTKKYSKKIINMSFPSYLDKDVWSIYKIFDRWLEAQYALFNFFFLDLVKSWGWIIFVIVILFYFDPIMASITLMMLPVMVVASILFFKKLYPIQRKIDKHWESVYKDLWNTMSVFSLVKTLTIENRFTKKISNKLDRTYDKQMKIEKWWTISDMYIAWFTTISRFFVLWSGVYFILKWTMDFATLFLFFSYIWWLYFGLWFLFSRLWHVQRWITASQKFYEEFWELENEHDWNKWKKIKFKWLIEFKNINFAYKKKKILNNLSFKVGEWKKIAFVWNTWAGKSTIINLFLRFWTVTEWKILIDEINIKKLNLKHFRKQIWVITQDSSLFNLTIKENLLFANSKANKSDIKNALKKAEANFVFDLEDWINTLIWERWLKLSWWEKQRLAIARLFLKDPKILILDEATSALDNKTEKKVQIALEKLMKWRTTIIIAHRLSTIKNVDKILMLKNWEILESWNYKELMKNKKYFYELANPDNLVIS